MGLIIPPGHFLTGISTRLFLWARRWTCFLCNERASFGFPLSLQFLSTCTGETMQATRCATRGPGAEVSQQRHHCTPGEDAAVRGRAVIWAHGEAWVWSCAGELGLRCREQRGCGLNEQQAPKTKAQHSKWRGVCVKTMTA